jgi:hypothetical protein
VSARATEVLKKHGAKPRSQDEALKSPVMTVPWVSLGLFIPLA